MNPLMEDQVEATAKAMWNKSRNDSKMEWRSSRLSEEYWESQADFARVILRTAIRMKAAAP